MGSGRAPGYSSLNEQPPHQSPRLPPRRSILSLKHRLFKPPSHPLVPAIPKAPIEEFSYDYPHQPSQNPRPRRSLFVCFFSNWWLSILFTILSALALGAIILLLLLVNGKPLSTLPLSVTVNTCISFLSSTSKACMLISVSESISQLKCLWFRQPRRLQEIQVFDEASRGPLGAAKMMFRTGWGNLAVLGAAIMVLSLVMESFAQLAVSYPVRSIRVEGAAHQKEAYVHIEWAWMALPAALIAASVVVLLATIVKNERIGAVTWKSNTLALLFHGLEGMERAWKGHLGLEERKQMREIARHTKVLLPRADNGEWKLRNVD